MLFIQEIALGKNLCDSHLKSLRFNIMLTITGLPLLARLFTRFRRVFMGLIIVLPKVHL